MTDQPQWRWQKDSLADAQAGTEPNPRATVTVQPLVLGVDLAADTTAKEPERFESPRDTREWKPGRQDGIETFTLPDGRVFTRCQGDEGADAVVDFVGPRSRGMTPVRLVLAEHSYALKGAATRQRKRQRELRKRGYDVE